MRGSVCSCWLAALLAAFPQAQQQPGSVSGTVVRGDTGEPVRRAVVALRPVEPGRRSTAAQTAVSGPDGRFEITGVAPGQYRIRVNRNGFLTAEFGQRSYDRPGAPVTVLPGAAASNLTVKLMPAAVISGTVVNEDGERVSYVSVTALKATYSQGRTVWMPAGSASTNDRGEYRIFDLNPGRYYISARYSASYGLGFRADPSRGDEGYAVMYYPGTFDPAAARPVEVAPGSDAGGVDIRLAPARMVRVSGAVRYESAPAAPEAPAQGRGMPGGRGFAPRPMVSLIPQGPIAIAGPQGRRAVPVEANGTFEIRGVLPGAYVLTADLFDRNRRQAARMPLTVGNTNLEGVTLTLAPVPVLPGLIRLDSKESVKLDGLRVSLQGQDDAWPMGGGLFSGGPVRGAGAVSADGKFSLENLSPQVYSLNLTGLPDSHYISAVRLNDVDVTHSPVDLSGGVLGNLVITLSSGAGIVEGTVTEEKRLAEGATVVLIPDGPRAEVAHYYKTATTDQNGHFTMKGIAPGEYKIFAWDEVSGGAYRDPAFRKKFESKGKAVSVKQGGQHNVQLELLSASQAEP